MASSLHSFVRPKDHSFIPTIVPFAVARSSRQGWPLFSGHPKGSSLTAASTMAPFSVSEAAGEEPRTRSCAISRRHCFNRRCNVRS
jgi:hypothetical protein